MIMNAKSGMRMILNAIKDYGPISKREIQEKTGLSWGHISQVTKKFLEEGYIEISEKELTAGRARELLDITADYNYFVGIDLNGARVRIVVTNMKGTIIEEMRQPLRSKEASGVLDELFGFLDKVIAAYDDKNILGIGFAVKGVVSSESGTSVYIGGIKGWNDVPLKKLSEERYDIETVVMHDPDSLISTECSIGLLKNQDVKNVILVSYSFQYGIGMSIMINGRIYTGHQGKAGELGCSIIDISEERGLEYLESFFGSEGKKVDPDLLIGYVARSIAMANSFLAPEVVILHLPEKENRQKITERVGEYLKKYSYNQDVRFAVSHLEKNAKALGAALYIIDRKIEQII